MPGGHRRLEDADEVEGMKNVRKAVAGVVCAAVVIALAAGACWGYRWWRERNEYARVISGPVSDQFPAIANAVWGYAGTHGGELPGAPLGENAEFMKILGDPAHLRTWNVDHPVPFASRIYETPEGEALAVWCPEMLYRDSKGPFTVGVIIYRKDQTRTYAKFYALPSDSLPSGEDCEELWSQAPMP